MSENFARVSDSCAFPKNCHESLSEDDVQIIFYPHSIDLTTSGYLRNVVIR